MTTAPLPQEAPSTDWPGGIAGLRDAAPPCPGADRLQRLRQEDAALDQYRDNIDTLSRHWQQQEARLEDIALDLIEARGLIARTCTNGADLAGVASSLGSLRNRLARPAATTRRTIGETPPDPGIADDAETLWVADGKAKPMQPAMPDIAGLIAPLAGAILLFEQARQRRDAVAWRVEIDRTLLDLDAGCESLQAAMATIANERNLLQALSDNHANLSLSNKQLAPGLGALDDAAAAALLQGHQTALQASRRALAVLAELSLFDER